MVEVAHSSEPESILSVLRDDGLLTITINRPSKRNALDQASLDHLGSLFEAGRDDLKVKLVLLTAAGDKCFAAGGDLRELDALRSLQEATEMSRRNREVFNKIRTFPVPVIAGLNGDALGGGAELAVACDLRVAASHARIGFLQGRLAITTAWGGAMDLASLIGPARALRLLCRSDLVSAAEGLAIGLLDHVAKPDEPLGDVLDVFCTPMMERPRHVLSTFKALSIEHRRFAGREELETLETKLFARAWIDEAHWRAAEDALTRNKS
jgi:enoyl-CoA hydratase